MPHIGLVCPPYTGHLNAMTTLGRELRRRGLRVTLICPADAEPNAVNAGLEFVPIGKQSLPAGSTARFAEQQGKLSGLAAVRYMAYNLRDNADVQLRELPDIVRTHGIDGLLIDQVTPAANTVAERLDVPFVTVCTALALHTEPGVPPCVTPWPYRDSPFARWRNAIGNRGMLFGLRPMVKLVNERRAEWGMPPVRRINDATSNLAQIAQQPAFFDFPREQLPDCFHYTGLFQSSDGGRADVPFPWERLTGQPLIYASMGTLHNRIPLVFHKIAEACAGLDAQLVISLGSRDAEPLADLAGSPIVVGYAPQLELLRQASLVITHAGMNTTLESLAQGVPLVALPVTNDQPGIAARLTYLGAGEFVAVQKLDAARLRAAVSRVLTNPDYLANAGDCQRELAGLNGVGCAADVVEQALGTGLPVVAARRSSPR